MGICCAGVTLTFRLTSAEKHTGLLAEVFSVLAFVPLGTLAQNATRNSIIQDAWALTEAPGLSPLTKKQYQIQTKWLEQNEIAQAEIEMIPGGGAPPNETYITIVADLTVSSHVHADYDSPLDYVYFSIRGHEGAL